MTDLPFKAHYTDDAGDIQCRTFATNAEAHEFRARMVDGRLPKGEADERPAEGDAPEKTPVEDDVPHTDAPEVTLGTASKPAPSNAAVLNGPKVQPSETGANG